MIIKKANRRLTILMIFLLILVILSVIVFTSNSRIENHYKNYTYDSSYVKELDNIIVLKQKASYTCNVTAIAIVKTYLGVEVSEDEVRSELDIQNRETGMLPNEFLQYSNKSLEPLSYSVSLLNPKSEDTILKVIVASLSNDLPVVIFYAREDDWNRPNYDTHYAVIYGIDLRNKTVKLSNPYGYLEELTFSQLYEGLNYKNYKSEPFIHQLGKLVGRIKKNTLFILEKTMQIN